MGALKPELMASNKTESYLEKNLVKKPVSMASNIRHNIP